MSLKDKVPRALSTSSEASVVGKSIIDRGNAARSVPFAISFLLPTSSLTPLLLHFSLLSCYGAQRTQSRRIQICADYINGFTSASSPLFSSFFFSTRISRLWHNPDNGARYSRSLSHEDVQVYRLPKTDQAHSINDGRLLTMW